MPRHGRRNRERQTKRIVVRGEWWFSGRLAVVVEMDKRGVVSWQVRGDPSRVGGVDREIAADRLRRDFMPRMTHEETYALLWG